MIEQLGAHAAAGRLTPAELAQRTERALAARTEADLAALLLDLPAPVRTDRTRRWFVAILGSSRRRQRVRLDGRATSVAVLASPDIDLCAAELTAQETVVHCFAVIGSPDIYVPDSAELEISGFSVAGGYAEKGSRRIPPPGAPVIRIRSYGLIGGYTVWRLPPELQSLPPADARKAARALERASARELSGAPDGTGTGSTGTGGTGTDRTGAAGE